MNLALAVRDCEGAVPCLILNLFVVLRGSSANLECRLLPRVLWCQQLDENARCLASILDAPFYVVQLEGLVDLFGGRRIALSRFARCGQSQRKVAA